MQRADLDPIPAKEAIGKRGAWVIDEGRDPLQLANDPVVFVDQRVEPPLQRVTLAGDQVAFGIERSALFEYIVVVVCQLSDVVVEAVDVGLGDGVTGMQLGETGVEFVSLREQFGAVALQRVTLAYERPETGKPSRDHADVVVHAGARTEFSAIFPPSNTANIPAKKAGQAATGRRRNRPRISAAAVVMFVPGP